MILKQSTRSIDIWRNCNNLGYVNTDYCFDLNDTSTAKTIKIPEYIVVVREQDGKITYTKQKVVGIATNASRNWDDEDKTQTRTEYTIDIFQKQLKQLAIVLSGNYCTINKCNN